MEFVETYHAGDRSVYLPGSSLKGAIRAHCERIVRTLGSERPNNSSIWTCNPLKDKANNRLDLSCSKRLDDENKARKKARKPEFTGSEIPHIIMYCLSSFWKYSYCFSCPYCRCTSCQPGREFAEKNEMVLQLTESTVLSLTVHSTLRLFTAGAFKTTITIKNFTTAQLALIALAIRDFDEQRVSIGFAKSRGLGQVNMKVNSVEIRYPTAVIENQQMKFLGNQADSFGNNVVVGAGELVNDAESYGFPTDDSF